MNMFTKIGDPNLGGGSCKATNKTILKFVSPYFPLKNLVNNK